MTKFKHSFLGLILSCLVFAPLSVAAAAVDPSLIVVNTSKEHPGSLPILLSLDHIAQELHLKSLQRSVIAGLRNDYHLASMKITAVPCKNPAEATQQQRELDRITLRYDERTLALLNPWQRQRLREIERQLLGGTLLTTPSEQQFLGLTEQQKKKIAAIAQDDHKKAAAINLKAKQGKLNYHQQTLALRKNRLAHAHAMLHVLTKEQLGVWEKAQGAKVVLK